MRTLVDIPDTEIRALAELCARVNQPRAALIREAIVEYVEKHRQPAVEEAFGCWDAETPDGLTYQEKVRAEW
ncbi:MAG TPA: ribbon-helix-helix domain-containing protein [Acetobacteraceae bacterium]|jgi:predicted transcriptional regulator|nr:ribbon-helix-helix domain-containing protein [Acetobacteraceae bacterium]